MRSNGSHLSRYHALASEAAWASLSDVPDATPLAIGVAPAMTLLGHRWPFDRGLAALGSGQTRFNDSLGFSRPVYHPLLIHFGTSVSLSLPLSAQACSTSASSGLLYSNLPLMDRDGGA